MKWFQTLSLISLYFSMLPLCCGSTEQLKSLIELWSDDRRLSRGICRGVDEPEDKRGQKLTLIRISNILDGQGVPDEHIDSDRDKGGGWE